MSKFTQTLGLPITTNSNLAFGEWWKLINGDGTADGKKSAFQIIDDYLKDFKPTSNVTIKDSIAHQWKGTAAPNSGVVDKVYLNTNLSIGEVKTILDTLNIEQSPDEHGDVFGVYPIISNADQSKVIGVMKVNDEYIIIIYANGKQEFVFKSASNDGIYGWLDKSGECEFNDDVFDISLSGVVNQNDKLSSLISITPFEEVPEQQGGIYIDETVAVAGNVNFTNTDKKLESIKIGNEVFYNPIPVSVNLVMEDATSGNISQDDIDILKASNDNYIYADNVKFAFEGHSPSGDVLQYSTTMVLGGYTYIITILVNCDTLVWNCYRTLVQSDVKVDLSGLVAYKSGGPVAIPSSGYVEKIYINKELSSEEIVGIIDNIQPTSMDMYKIFSYTYNSTDGNLTIVKLEDIGFFIVDMAKKLFLYISNSQTQEMAPMFHPGFEANFIGWNPNVGEEYEINAEVSSSSNNGLQNDKLIDLFSITPFNVQGGLYETNEDGTPNTDKPIQTGISEERVNELIDLKIGDFLGGES